MSRALVVMLLAGTTFLGGCSTVPKSDAAKRELLQDAELTIKTYKELDPQLFREFFYTSKAYAVFPSVGKGGWGFGGAYGRGVFYEADKHTGFCDMTQATIGFQLGGQAYSQVIFFETPDAVKEFKTGNMEFSANASAVAVTLDASATADYENGVAVFTHSGKGLMYEASIGGQKFNFVPK